MTELIVTARKVGVGDPDRQAITILAHTPFNVTAQAFTESVRVCAKGTNPELASQSIADTLDGVFQTAVALCTALVSR